MFCDVTKNLRMYHYKRGHTSPNVEMGTNRQEHEIAKRIGRALAKHRLAKKLTQEQVAEHLKVEQETISRFERGATLPPLLRLIDLANLFDVPLDSLVRAGSARTLDQAVDIANFLKGVKEEDREWVRGLIAQICEKLSARP